LEELCDIPDVWRSQHRDRSGDVQPRQIQPSHESELPPQPFWVFSASEQLHDAPSALYQPHRSLPTSANTASQPVDGSSLVDHLHN
jgi:hypothetical protein